VPFTFRHIGQCAILGVIGVLMTVGAGYFGWTMIQNDHVGVSLTTEQERIEGLVGSRG
jgi:hypothetical protein